MKLFNELNEARRDKYGKTNQVYLKRPPVAWWMGPAKRRTVCGVKYAANGAIALLLLGLFANLTVIGSVEFFGIVPFSSLIAFSASHRWSNRINPTPFDRPTIMELRQYLVVNLLLG